MPNCKYTEAVRGLGDLLRRTRADKLRLGEGKQAVLGISVCFCII